MASWTRDTFAQMHASASRERGTGSRSGRYAMPKRDQARCSETSAGCSSRTSAASAASVGGSTGAAPASDIDTPCSEMGCSRRTASSHDRRGPPPTM